MCENRFHISRIVSFFSELDDLRGLLTDVQTMQITEVNQNNLCTAVFNCVSLRQNKVMILANHRGNSPVSQSRLRVITSSQRKMRCLNKRIAGSHVYSLELSTSFPQFLKKLLRLCSKKVKLLFVTKVAISFFFFLYLVWCKCTTKARFVRILLCNFAALPVLLNNFVLNKHN